MPPTDAIWFCSLLYGCIHEPREIVGITGIVRIYRSTLDKHLGPGRAADWISILVALMFLSLRNVRAALNCGFMPRVRGRHAPRLSSVW